MVVKGKVELTSRDLGSRRVAGPGEPVAMNFVLTREPSTVSATALEDTFALSIGAEDFFNLLSQNTEIEVSIFKYFTRRLEKIPTR